jgi:hypothetical protein
MIRRVILLPALVLAGLAGGCNNNTTTATAPEAPTLVSEVFSGTVTVNGAFTHPFAVGRAGSVTVQLTALSPDDTVSVSLALGTWNGSACQIVIANDTAKLSTAVLGTATAAGTLCIRVSDVGNLTAPTDYDVKVDHY